MKNYTIKKLFYENEYNLFYEIKKLKKITKLNIKKIILKRAPHLTNYFINNYINENIENWKKGIHSENQIFKYIKNRFNLKEPQINYCNPYLDNKGIDFYFLSKETVIIIVCRTKYKVIIDHERITQAIEYKSLFYYKYIKLLIIQYNNNKIKIIDEYKWTTDI